jgi:hypothetical protein
LRHTVDRVFLAPGQAQRLDAGAVDELQRQHTHADQIRAVNTLE